MAFDFYFKIFARETWVIAEVQNHDKMRGKLLAEFADQPNQGEEVNEVFATRLDVVNSKN